MNCVENGHQFEVIRYVKMNDDRIQEEYECRDCAETYTEYVDRNDVNEDMVVRLCSVCEEEIEHYESICQNCKEEDI